MTTSPSLPPKLTVVEWKPKKGRKTTLKNKGTLKRKIKSFAAKKKKETFADFARRWNLPKYFTSKKQLRYSNPPEKGVYWYWFSIFIRTRDIATYGTCISCNRGITMESCDCGHFIPASQCGRDLLMDKRNNNAECSRCNAWDELHLLGYAKGLDIRYGPGTADELLQRHKEYKEGPPLKDFKAKEYAEMAQTIINQLKEI